MAPSPQISAGPTPKSRANKQVTAHTSTETQKSGTSREVQGCQWGDETVVVISQPFVYGGWLPLAVRDGQARLMNWDELTG